MTMLSPKTSISSKACSIMLFYSAVIPLLKEDHIMLARMKAYNHLIDIYQDKVTELTFSGLKKTKAGQRKLLKAKRYAELFIQLRNVLKLDIYNAIINDKASLEYILLCLRSRLQSRETDLFKKGLKAKFDGQGLIVELHGTNIDSNTATKGSFIKARYNEEKVALDEFQQLLKMLTQIHC